MYGGFWRRVAAMFLDVLILGALDTIILSVLGLNNRLISSELTNQANTVNVNLSYDDSSGISIVLFWLYFSILESSKYKATIGKMVLGLKVSDIKGNRITFSRATGRFFAKIISTVLFLAGYIMIVFTRKKQGLHDKLAKTLVLKTETPLSRETMSSQ